jgi:hypothetical protein
MQLFNMTLTFFIILDMIKSDLESCYYMKSQKTNEYSPHKEMINFLDDG